MKTPYFKFKQGEYTLCFKQLYNDYMNDQKNKKLHLELVYNPNKLFLEDIYQKKRNFDLQKENMNITKDLFDGNKIDIDIQKYLNYNSKNKIKIKTQNTNKLSQFLLFKSKTNFNFLKNKKIHKNFSQNIISSNNIKNQKLLFPKIFMEKKLKNKKSFKKRSLTINTNNFIERNKKYEIKKINELHINSNNYYTNNDLKIFKDYKSNYLTKLNSLITENKKISKSLSGFIKNNLEII